MLSAQFYTTGDNSWRVKWNTVETDNFSIIYPVGADSLAKVYGQQLEKYRIPVSRTSGFLPGGGRNTKMPVVLHTYNSSNGSVAWAPKRMDLFTIPSLYDTEPLPWTTNLAVHESRHVSQMQVGLNNAHRPFNWFLGEMWNGLAAQLYLGISNLEGDAVIAETALTNSGRGRTADFLNYYKVAFDNGDFRSWNQWRFMSQHGYSPDHYALGYLTLGGLRYLYDIPDIVGVASHAASRNPLNLCTVIPTTKKMTGRKFKEAFAEVCDTLHAIWKSEADARAPFIYMEPVTAEPRLYTDYSKLVFMKDTLYAVKSGHLTAPVLTRIFQDSSEDVVSRFSQRTSSIKADEKNGRLYWTETYSDPRWGMKQISRIKYSTLKNSNKKYLGKADGNVVFNPDMNPESGLIVSVAYRHDGKAELCIVNGLNGKPVLSIDVPDGLQPVETAWIGQDIYVSMIDEGGYGIWEYKDGEWKEVLGSQPVKVRNLKSFADELVFTCDRTGVNEIYHFNPVSRELTQKTVTRYGASDFAYTSDGKWLYFTSQTMKGMKVFRTPSDSLVSRKADFSNRHTWVLAEKLAEQERKIAADAGYDSAVSDVKPEFSEPERYRKFPHAFNLHSWAPFYVSVDNIKNMSYDYTWEAVSLGATGIIQNRLSNFVGEFGYSAHKDPYQTGRWRNSGHLKFTYSGWYPVIEASVDYNDRSAYQTSIYKLTSKDILGRIENEGYGIESHPRNVPLFSGNISVYVPLNFSQGGWNSGFIPKISYSISNDMYDNEIVEYEDRFSKKEDEEGNLFYVRETIETGRIPGKNAIQQTIMSSLRGYAMTSTPNSAVFPSWGIGGEIGYLTGLENRDFFSSMQYLYAYGYIPGIISSHGIKLSMMMQEKCYKKTLLGTPVVNMLPRGFVPAGGLLRTLTYLYSKIDKFTVDYAAPVYIGDWSIGGTLFAVKRLVITPHFDYTFIKKKGNLYSAGLNLSLDLHSLLWLEYPCSFGLTCSYNGGSLYNDFAKRAGIGQYYIGPTFNVSF